MTHFLMLSHSACHLWVMHFDFQETKGMGHALCHTKNTSYCFCKDLPKDMNHKNVILTHISNLVSGFVVWDNNIENTIIHK